MEPDLAELSSKKHFSMIRSFQAADFFTIANGCCGVAAVFGAMRFLAHQDRWQLYRAAALIPLAIVFDVLDGTVARARHKASVFGRELDSLADIISFGVAPATLAFSIGLDSALDEIILLYFVVCGVSRLARFNVTAEQLAGPGGKVRYFEGTPIPTSIVPLTLLLIAAATDHLMPVTVFGARVHLTVLLFALSGSLMISKTIRIPKP